MPTCPGEGLLLRYTRGRGDEPDLDGVVVHLESCEACRRRAAELVDTPVDDLNPRTPEIGRLAGQDGTDEGLGLAELLAAVEAGHRAVAKESGTAAEDPPADPLDTVSESISPSPYSSYTKGPDRGRGAFPTFQGYEVLERLGGGGMGVVYKARQVGLNRLVAVKMIREDRQMRTDYLARFMYEAEAVARLRHPNIIQIFDIGEADGSPFVALEFLEGGNLDDKLAGNPQPGRTAAEMAMTLARAIHVAHQAGIIHRDLKPSNILLTADGVLKISDFGLAKRIDGDSQQTDSDQIKGTPSYMAPEQASNSKHLGPAADVYALGAIFYEMLVGRPPFKGETGFETVRQLLHDDPVPPSRLVPRIARDLETICLKCLAKDPLKRYRSAEAMADDLRRHLDGQPIEARRTPPWERGVKWVRRRPATATFLSLGVLLCLGVSAVLLEYQRNRDEQIANRWKEGNQKLYDALGQKDLVESRRRLVDIEEMFARDSAPRLLDLKALASKELARIDKQLHEQDVRDREFAALETFRGLRDEALFHDIPIPGLDPEGDRKAKREAAAKALEIFKAAGSGDSWALALPPNLLEKEVEIAESCYELLFILAGTEASPEQGLRRLDQADSLHLPRTRAYHRRREAFLAGMGDAAAAKKEHELAESLRPKGVLDHFLLGQECYKRDPATGLRHFSDALQERTDHFWARCLSALCLLDPLIAKPEEAIILLNVCLERRGEYAWLYLLHGFANSQHAQVLLGQAGKTPSRRGGGGQFAGLKLGYAEMDYNRAMDRLKPGDNGDLRYALLINRGLLKLQSRQLDKAAEDLREAIALKKTGAHAYALLGRVYRDQDNPDLDAASEQFSRAIERNPNRAEYYRSRAEVTLKRPSPTPDQRAGALSDLDRAIRLERAQDRITLALDYLDRARLLERDHLHPDALAACEAAIAANPDDLKAQELRIKLLSGMKRHAEVIRSCNELDSRGLASPGMIELRALSRSCCNDFPRAIDDYTRLLALRPDRAPLLTARGRLYLVSKEPERALRDFQEAVQLEPINGDNYADRGSARVSLGRLTEAVSDAEEALKYGEPTWQRYLVSARIYARASAASAAEVRTKGRAAVVLSDRYRERAVELVREARQRLPRVEEPKWIALQTDPDLGRILRRLGPAPRRAVPIDSRPSKDPSAK